MGQPVDFEKRGSKRTWATAYIGLLWVLFSGSHSVYAHVDTLAVGGGPTANVSTQDQPQAASWYTRGFYNTDEHMGVGMKWMGDYKSYEFTWARIPLRRFSVGIFAQMDIDSSQPEKLGSLGGGLSGALFPLLPGKTFPFGVFVAGRIGGTQCFDEEWGRHGGTLRGHAEAGAFAQFGREVMLIPRAAIRRTEYWAMRHGKKVGSGYVASVHGGVELKIRTIIPGFFIASMDGDIEYAVTLRFAYK